MNIDALVDSTLTGDAETAAMSDELSQIGDYDTDAIVELARKDPGAGGSTAGAMQGLVYALDRVSVLRGALDRIRFDQPEDDREETR